MRNIKKVSFILLLIILISTLAFSSDKQKKLPIGSIVKIVLKNGNTFQGMIDSIDEKKIQLLLINTDIQGSKVEFKFKDIKKITPLVILDKKTRKEIKRNVRKAISKRAISREQNKISEVQTPLNHKPDQKESKINLVDKFPLEEGWNEAKFTELSKKDFSQLSADEKEFVENFHSLQELRKRKEYESILRNFPPSEGWSKEKYEFLKNKFNVIHVLPTEKEKEFINKFPLWQEAVERLSKRK